jgi:F0F1-type ATP synthase assembly protein I
MDLGPATSLGANMTAAVVVGTAAGIYMDRKFGRSDSLFALCGLCFGVLYGAYELWKIIRLTDKEDGEES